MSLRINALILGAVVAVTFAVGMAGAESTPPVATTAGTSDNSVATGSISAGTISGGLSIVDGILTVQYRGENLSFLARVPLAP